METDLNSIHRWLSKVPDVHPARNDTDDPNQLDLALADILPVSSNINEIARKPAKVGGTLLGQSQIQLQKAGHGVQPSFDRKPRHKTREDRYEYKGTGPGKSRSISHKDKNKRGRSRNHTINDVFRAPNVARERLTLRGNLNFGIFNKGKASSPLKLGRVPDSAFSERKILTKKHQRSSSKSPTTDKRRKVDHKPPNKGSSQQQKRPKYISSELLKEFEIQGNDTEQLISQVRDFDQPNFEPKIDQGRCVGRILGLDVQRDQQLYVRSHSSFLMDPVTKTASCSQSTQSYTWSQTDLAQSQHEHALEIELLRLLRVGLFLAQGVEPDGESNQNHTYYNLDELKGILGDRKKYWTPEPSQIRQIVATPPISGSQRGSITAANKTRENLRSENPVDSMSQNTEESPPDRNLPHQVFSNLVSQLHDNRTVSSISQRKRLEQGRINIEDVRYVQESLPDDAFFSNLDAAFWEIVDPQTQNEMDTLVMMGTQQSSPTFDFEEIITTVELNSAEIPKRPSQGGLSHVLVGVETLYPIPPAAHDRFDLKTYVTNPENDQDDVILRQSPQKEVSNRTKLQRSRLYPNISHYPNDDPIPPGFWRQNRLY